MPAYAFPENVTKLAAQKKIRDLREYCQKSKIPMFVTVYVPEKKEYISDIVSPISISVEAEPDKITEHLNVANGFDTVPPKDNLMNLDADGVARQNGEDAVGVQNGDAPTLDVERYIDDLIALCRENSQPVFVSVYIPDTHSYITNAVTLKEYNITSIPDRIAKHIEVSNGYHTLPPQTELMLLDDDGSVSAQDYEDFDTNEVLAALEMCNNDNEEASSKDA